MGRKTWAGGEFFAQAGQIELARGPEARSRGRRNPIIEDMNSEVDDSQQQGWLQGSFGAVQDGQRFDKALAAACPSCSRQSLQRRIEQGQAWLNGAPAAKKSLVRAGDSYRVRATPPDRLSIAEAEGIPLNLVYEDDQLLVVDKPAGLVMHRAPGNWGGTVENALLALDERLAALPRAGIVHRLDKDTSGLFVVARDEQTRLKLIEEIARRRMRRRYWALVEGLPISGGTIDGDIGRHPRNRLKMAVRPTGGKPALTRYSIACRYRAHTLVNVEIESGRTHQIRVHMQHLGFPVVGDPLYGRLRLPAGAAPATVAALQTFRRQALHARSLELFHPRLQRPLCWESPLPADFAGLCRVLDSEATAATESGNPRNQP